jgi:hypothetical protein
LLSCLHPSSPSSNAIKESTLNEYHSAEPSITTENYTTQVNIVCEGNLFLFAIRIPEISFIY